VAVGADGAIYVTGVTQGPDYLERMDVTATRQAFLARYDGTGTGQWVRKYGVVENQLSARPQVAAVPGGAGAYVAGGEGGRSFVARYNAKGETEWIRKSIFVHGGGIAARSDVLYQANANLLAIYSDVGEVRQVRQLPDENGYALRLLATGPSGLYGAGTTGRLDNFAKVASQHAFVGRLLP
jgi:hypothetical protein